MAQQEQDDEMDTVEKRKRPGETTPPPPPPSDVKLKKATYTLQELNAQAERHYANER